MYFRDKQEQSRDKAGTSKYKAGTIRGKNKTDMDKTGTCRDKTEISLLLSCFVFFCPYFVPACPFLDHAGPCFVPDVIMWSLLASVLSLIVPVLSGCVSVKLLIHVAKIIVCFFALTLVSKKHVSVNGFQM